jgi:hypothetical protein
MADLTWSQWVNPLRFFKRSQANRSQDEEREQHELQGNAARVKTDEEVTATLLQTVSKPCILWRFFIALLSCEASSRTPAKADCLLRGVEGVLSRFGCRCRVCWEFPTAVKNVPPEGAFSSLLPCSRLPLTTLPRTVAIFFDAVALISAIIIFATNIVGFRDDSPKPTLNNEGTWAGGAIMLLALGLRLLLSVSVRVELRWFQRLYNAQTAVPKEGASFLSNRRAHLEHVSC